MLLGILSGSLLEEQVIVSHLSNQVITQVNGQQGPVGLLWEVHREKEPPVAFKV